MKNVFLKALILVLGITFSAGVSYSQNTYIGAEKCGMCHKGAAKGDQLKKWKDSKHSKSANAKDVAGKKECETCHNPVADLKKEGVSCEVCHGAGSAYKSQGVMKVKADALKKGLKEPNEQNCKECHNASKAPKGHAEIKFDFAKASETISHKKPK